MTRIAKWLTGLAVVLLAVGLGLLIVQARQTAVAAGPAIGAPAPAVDLHELGGGTFDLAAAHGRPVVLNFFSSFCEACRQEAPAFEALAQSTHGRADIVGVDLTVSEPSLAAVQGYVQAFGITYPVVLDKTGSVSDRYAVTGIPVTVFIDGQGRVRSIVTSELSYSAMQTQLEPLMHS